MEAERKAALRAGRAPPRSLTDPEHIASLVAASLPPQPRLEDEPPATASLPPPGSDEEAMSMRMYFERPEQLLDVFATLEESNLFLIQNCQDTEQQLDELRAAHVETAAAMVRQAAALEADMARLHQQLSAEQAKAAALRRKITTAAAAGAGDAVVSAGAGKAADRSSTGVGGPSSASGQGDLSDMEALLPELRARIVEVYERCGFRASASSDTISMLAQLEGRLESLLAQLEAMPPEYVQAGEKAKERERRVRVREARLKAQAEAHDARQRKMLERAQVRQPC